MKEQLSQLIKRIEESFPEETDLKGFAGISKVGIIASLNRSLGLTHHFPDGNDFDLVSLKREIARLGEKILHDLEKDFSKIDENKFNTILTNISKLITVIRNTYIGIVNIVPIRTEAEIGTLKEELSELQSNTDSLRRVTTEVLTLRDTAVEVITKSETTIKASADQFTIVSKASEKGVQDAKEEALTTINKISTEINKTNEEANIVLKNLEDQFDKFSESENQIGISLSEINNKKAQIEIISQSVEQWKKDILSVKDQITEQSNEYADLNTNSAELQKKIESTYEKVSGQMVDGVIKKKGLFQETEDLKKQLTDFLESQQTKYKAQFTEIEGLLPGATSAGLAQAYQDQKLSYRWPIRLWSGAFIITMLIMISASVVLLSYQLTNKPEPSLSEAVIMLLKDLPFFIPTIWLAAYASKQQSQYKRLQQEYAFKETNAKSFNGHKVQIEKLMNDGATDEELLTQLVAQLVVITSQNPSVTLDNKSHEDSSPILKLVDKYLPSFKKSAKTD